MNLTEQLTGTTVLCTKSCSNIVWKQENHRINVNLCLLKRNHI